MQVVLEQGPGSLGGCCHGVLYRAAATYRSLAAPSDFSLASYTPPLVDLVLHSTFGGFNCSSPKLINS